jgi:hypothetical protein
MAVVEILKATPATVLRMNIPAIFNIATDRGRRRGDSLGSTEISLWATIL